MSIEHLISIVDKILALVLFRGLNETWLHKSWRGNYQLLHRRGFASDSLPQTFSKLNIFLTAVAGALVPLYAEAIFIKPMLANVFQQLPYPEPKDCSSLVSMVMIIRTCFCFILLNVFSRFNQRILLKCQFNEIWFSTLEITNKKEIICE